MELTENITETLSYETYKAVEKAQKRGFTIVYATDTTLAVDLDTQDAVEQFSARLVRLNETNPELRPYTADQWTSKSGVGRHKVVSIAIPLPMAERLLLEVCLGGDPVRGMHGLRKHRAQDDEAASMLFRPPASAVESVRTLTDDDTPF